MKSRLLEHALSIVLVTLFFSVLIIFMRGKEADIQADRTAAIAPYLELDFIDFGNPLHRAQFAEALDVFYPDRRAGNDSLIQSIESFRQEQFTSEEYKTGGEKRGLSSGKALQLIGMFAQFCLVYLIVMVLSHRASTGLAIIRFVNMRAARPSALAQIILHARGSRPRGSSWYLTLLFLLLKSFGVFLGYAVLFAPAYVIAYSIRSGFDTDSYLFMVILGVISNGLLITRASRFSAFLTAESRKGYVQTSIVKNLDASYQWGKGIPYKAVVEPTKVLSSHVFRHIYRNARHQYLPSLKEHASFLITGLIIIEMALNIQGHLGYELLQNILYRQYDVAVAIIVGIFLIVKATDMVIDAWVLREAARYENK